MRSRPGTCTRSVRTRAGALARVLATAVGLALALAPVAARSAYAADARETALDLSKQALDAFLAQDFAGAAALYGEAYRTWPTELIYLYNAARADQRAGHLDAAESAYLHYLQLAPRSAPEEAKARFHLEEVRAAKKPAAPVAAPFRSAPVHAPAPPPLAGPDTGRSTSGIALVVVGSVGAVAGGVVLAMAAAKQSALDGRLAQTDATGKIIGIGHPEAINDQNDINTQAYVGWAIVGGGAVVGIVGAVLLATAPSQVTVAPWANGGGVAVAWSF